MILVEGFKELIIGIGIPLSNLLFEKQSSIEAVSSRGRLEYSYSYSCLNRARGAMLPLPSFVITVLPDGKTTEIYLDFDKPYGYYTGKHVRNKFILNNSSQELTLQDKIIKSSDLELYAKDLLK